MRLLSSAGGGERPWFLVDRATRVLRGRGKGQEREEQRELPGPHTARRHLHISSPNSLSPRQQGRAQEVLLFIVAQNFNGGWRVGRGVTVESLSRHSSDRDCIVMISSRLSRTFLHLKSAKVGQAVSMATRGKEGTRNEPSPPPPPPSSPPSSSSPLSK